MFASLSVDLSYRILTVLFLFFLCGVEPDDLDQCVTEVEACQRPQREGEGESSPVPQAGESELPGDEVEDRRRGNEGQPESAWSARVVVDRSPQQGEGAPEVEPGATSADRHRTEAEVEAAVGDLVAAGAVEQPQPPAEDRIVSGQPRSEDHTSRPQAGQTRDSAEQKAAGPQRLF